MYTSSEIGSSQYGTKDNSDDLSRYMYILANRPGTCRIVPENEVPSCSSGNNAKSPAILITLGQRPSFVLLSYISI